VNLRQLIPIFDNSVSRWGIDAQLLRWLTFLWLFAGLVILFSASYAVGDSDYSDGLYYIKRQVISVLLGLVAFNIVVNSPLRFILGISHWFVLALLGLILITLIPGIGTNANGATRWLSLGGIPIQPSELIKPFFGATERSCFWTLEPINMGRSPNLAVNFCACAGRDFATAQLEYNSTMRRSPVAGSSSSWITLSLLRGNCIWWATACFYKY
jgi:cell division protein FtsW